MLQIACSKGCGYPISVSGEQIEEAQRLGVPLIVSHDVCPPDRKVQPKFRVTVTVERIDPVENPMHVEDPTEPEWVDGVPEKLTSVGDTVEAASFPDAFDSLTAAINKQWERVSQMRHIVEGD